MDDEDGLLTVPAPRGVHRGHPMPSLARHPRVFERGACGLCGRAGWAYAHPNPLRTGVVLFRCYRHRGPRFAEEDPRAAPGGGVYRLSPSR
jgi:hypothetical protein